MLQKLKKMIPVMAIVMLFSSTIAYAATYDIDAYLAPSGYRHSALREKSVEGSARIVSIGSPDDCYIRYTVINNAGYQKSEPKVVEIVSTSYVAYPEKNNVQVGDFLKLKAENYATSNGGAFVTLKTNWRP